MKRLVIALAALAVLAAGAARAADDEKDHPPAKGPGGPGGPGGSRPEMPLIGPRLMEDLKLTDEQKPKVDALASEFAKQRDKLRAEQKDNPENAKLREEIRAAREANDAEKMRSLRDQVAKRDKPLLDLRKEYTDKVRALLTDDQKKTLDEARERMRNRRGPGGPGGPGGRDGAPPPPPPPDKD